MRKISISILILCLLKTFIYCTTTNTNEYYEIQQNLKVNETIGQTYLIQSMNINPFFSCLSLCNCNPSCLTTVYQTNTGICILYSKAFQVTDLTNSVGSNVYMKKAYQSVSSSSGSTPSSSVTVTTPSSITVQPTTSLNTITAPSLITSTQSSTSTLATNEPISTTQSSTTTVATDTTTLITNSITELNARLLNGI